MQLAVQAPLGKQVWPRAHALLTEQGALAEPPLPVTGAQPHHTAAHRIESLRSMQPTFAIATPNAARSGSVRFRSEGSLIGVRLLHRDATPREHVHMDLQFEDRRCSPNDARSTDTHVAVVRVVVQKRRTDISPVIKANVTNGRSPLCNGFMSIVLNLVIPYDHARSE